MFMNWVRQGRLELPDQETETRMFEETIEAMEKHGRHQYEISNFGLSGHESQHTSCTGTMPTILGLELVLAVILEIFVTATKDQSNTIYAHYEQMNARYWKKKIDTKIK